MSTPPLRTTEVVSPDTCTHLTGHDHVASLGAALQDLTGQVDTLDRWGQLLADDERRVAYGAAGVMRAPTRYRWSRVVADTDAVYRSVLAARAPVLLEESR